MSPRTAFWLLFFVGLAPGVFFVAEVVHHQQRREQMLDSATVFQSGTLLKDKFSVNAVSLADLAASIEDVNRIGPTFTKVATDIIHDGEGLQDAELAYGIESRDRERIEHSFMEQAPVSSRVKPIVQESLTSQTDRVGPAVSECVVVCQAEPLRKFAALLGTDLKRHIFLRLAIDQANKTRKTVLSGPIRLSGENSTGEDLVMIRLVHGLILPGYSGSKVYVMTLLQLEQIASSVNREHPKCQLTSIADVTGGVVNTLWESRVGQHSDREITTSFQFGSRQYEATGVCIGKSTFAGKFIAVSAAVGSILVALLLAVLGKTITLQRVLEEQHRKELQDLVVEVI